MAKMTSRQRGSRRPDLSTLIAMILWAAAILLLTQSYALPAEYNRDAFQHWTDIDGDGLNTRQYIVAKARIISSVWVCPYTGEVFTDPWKMDVDHIIPLAWAWRHGAEQWTDSRRKEFANDPENLELVSADVNRAKGSKGPDKWLPPNLRYAGIYLHKFDNICRKYQLDCSEYQFAVMTANYEKAHNGWRP